MKKYGKLLTKISLIVLAVSLFLSLSLSDVIRLNPQLEGVSKAQLVSTAKKATVDEKVSVLIPADELPEAPAATEATMEWSPEGYPELDINGDGVFALAELGLNANFYRLLPYVITLLVLAFTSKSSRAPKAEGIPYDKGQR